MYLQETACIYPYIYPRQFCVLANGRGVRCKYGQETGFYKGLEINGL
jgi:hypothetical protein